MTSHRHSDNAAADLHQIGTVAELVGLSLPTIRHYEEVGVVVPSGRSSGGFRLYTDDDVGRLAQVKAMKPLGFTLEESGEILRLRAQVDSGDATTEEIDALVSFAERSDERTERLRQQLAQAHEFVAALRREVASSTPR